jgi:hypothetical protein
MVAAAGPLEMTGEQRAKLKGLARSHTAPARDVHQAKALLWATMPLDTAPIVRRVKMSKKAGVVSTSRRGGTSTSDDRCSTKSGYYFGTNYPRE